MYEPFAASTPKPKSTAARSVAASRSGAGMSSYAPASVMNMNVVARTSAVVSTAALFTSPAPTITAAQLLALRERLHLSRPVFAGYLRTNPRTLENWEQGRAQPNAQAALLIRLVEKYPDTVQRLATV